MAVLEGRGSHDVDTKDGPVKGDSSARSTYGEEAFMAWDVILWHWGISRCDLFRMQRGQRRCGIN